MEEDKLKHNKSSNYLVFNIPNLTQNLSVSSNRNKSLSKSCDKKCLYDFISSKNKLILKSCFDHRGTKKFLSEKEKALQEINLSEDITEEKKTHKKDKIRSHIKHRSHHQKSHNSHTKELRPSSTNDLKAYEKKYLEVEIKNPKKLSDKTHKYNDIPEEKTGKYENRLKINKKRIVPFNSISSNFSNIKPSEPLNLVYNNNDSLIHGIVNEMDETN